jgi:hypothetical protein
MSMMFTIRGIATTPLIAASRSALPLQTMHRKSSEGIHACDGNPPLQRSRFGRGVFQAARLRAVGRCSIPAARPGSFALHIGADTKLMLLETDPTTLWQTPHYEGWPAGAL